MTYARCRLLLGISCVGTIVTLCGLSLFLGLPEAYFSLTSPHWGDAAVELLIFFSIVSAILFPFELMGGFILPKKYSRINLTLPEFIKIILRATILHAGLSLGLATLLIFVSNTFSPLIGVVTFIASIFLLIAFQRSVAFLMSPPKSVEPLDGHKRPQVFTVDINGESCTGGIVGLPGFEAIFIPKNWRKDLSQEGWLNQIKRKEQIVASGLRTRGLIGAILFVTVGFLLSLSPANSSLLTTAGLINTTLWFTLWSFLGLLILSSPSRDAVFAADRLIATDGSKEFVDTLNKLEELQDGEPNRTVALESVFHPVPSVARRAAQLVAPKIIPSFLSAWNVARMSIFLSWAGFNLLSRAVHCNCGRPHLWVLLPTD